MVAGSPLWWRSLWWTEQWGAKYSDTMEQFSREAGGVPLVDRTSTTDGTLFQLIPGFVKFLTLKWQATKNIFDKFKVWIESIGIFADTASGQVAKTANGDGLHLAVNGIRNMWSVATTKFTELAGLVADIISAAATGTFQLAKTVVTKTVELIKSVVKFLGNLWPRIVDWNIRRKKKAPGPIEAFMAENIDDICDLGTSKGLEFIIEWLTQFLALPAVDWEQWLKTTLTDPFPDVATATYAGTRKGLPGDVTFVQQVAMPPDQYEDLDGDFGILGKGINLEGRVKLSIEFADAELTQSWADEPTMAYPIAHWSTPNEHGWMHHPDVTKMTLDVHSPDGPTEDYTSTPVTLPTDPLVATVVASSSAAVGFLTSPTLVRSLFTNILELEDAHEDLAFNSHTTVTAFFDHCLANNLQTLGIAQPALPIPTNTDHSYRFIDGGFVDNTALASTIGKIAADHPNDSYLGKFIHWDLDTTKNDGVDGRDVVRDSGTAIENRVAALFHIPDEPCNTVGGFCTNSSAPGQHNANGIGRPVSTIFEQAWPDTWTEYAYYNGLSAKTYSYYWSGTLTTVENKFYNVPAGKTLDLLVFSLNQPKEDQIFAGGDFLEPLWGTVYGDIARQQAMGAAPVIKDFIADEWTDPNLVSASTSP